MSGTKLIIKIDSNSLDWGFEDSDPKPQDLDPDGAEARDYKYTQDEKERMFAEEMGDEFAPQHDARRFAEQGKELDAEADYLLDLEKKAAEEEAFWRGCAEEAIKAINRLADAINFNVAQRDRIKRGDSSGVF